MYETVLSNLIITGIRSVSVMYNDPQAKGKKTDRSRWAVILKYEGQTVYISQGQQLLSDREHLILLPKGCSYEWTCTQAGHFLSLEFECEASFDKAISIPVKQSDRLLRQLQELEQTWNRADQLRQQICIRELYGALLSLRQPAPYVPGDKQQKLRTVAEYISQHCSEPLTNDRLAEVAGMSTVYFRKLFTQLMGVSPMAYARQLRIEKAKQMLHSDYGSLSQVALSLGYANLYDFSRDFKKHTGIAPSKY